MGFSAFLIDAAVMVATPVAISAGYTWGLGLCAGLTVIHLRRALAGRNGMLHSAEHDVVSPRLNELESKQVAQQIQLVAEVRARRGKATPDWPRRSPFGAAMESNDTITDHNRSPMNRFSSL